MTLSEQKEVIRRLEELQVAEGLSNKVVASLLGCSPAVWSQIRAGVYPGRTAKYLARGKKVIEDREARRTAPETDFVETTIARAILAVCRRAWEKPTIGLIVTPSGCGKTTALREFARERGEDSMLIQAGGYFSGKAGVLGEVARQLGIPDQVCENASLEDLGRQVRRNLAAKYQRGLRSPYVILVDEATTLSMAAIDILRNLHDDPECRAAVVLADTWRLHSALRNPHGIAGGTEQLRSRCGAAYLMPENQEIARDDVRLVARSVLRGLGHDGTLPREALSYLTKVANDPAGGRLRSVTARIQDVAEVAEHLGVEPVYDVRQIDFVATLSGRPCEFDHSANLPFDRVVPVGELAEAKSA